MRVNSDCRWLRRLATGAALLAACKSAPGPAAAEPRFVVADVIVAVNNQSRREMGIFLLTETGEHQLGQIAARSSRSFSLPGGLGDSPDSIRFEARERRAGRGIRSNPFSLSHGQQVLWTFDDKGSQAVTTK